MLKIKLLKAFLASEPLDQKQIHAKGQAETYKKVDKPQTLNCRKAKLRNCSTMWIPTILNDSMV